MPVFAWWLTGCEPWSKWKSVTINSHRRHTLETADYFQQTEYFQSGVCVCVCAVCPSVMSDSLQPHWLYPTRFPSPWNFLAKNTRMVCQFLLQGIFQIWDWRCIYCFSCIGRQILYHCTTWNPFPKYKLVLFLMIQSMAESLRCVCCVNWWGAEKLNLKFTDSYHLLLNQANKNKANDMLEENMEENVNAFFCHLGVRNSLLRTQNEETMENSDIFYYAKMKKKTLLLHWGNLSEAKWKSQLDLKHFTLQGIIW